MEIGALKRENFEVWVPFKDGEILIRFISAEELKEIGKNATRRTWDGKTEPDSEVDLFEIRRRVGLKAVRGWNGFTMEGQEFPYSEENCDFLIRKWTEFAKFVNDVCIDLQALVAAERRKKGKNSGLTSGQD